MVNKSGIHLLLGFVTWVTGVIVALSVAFGMIDGTLSLPVWLGGATLALIAGWIVVITTILGVVLVIVDKVNG